MGFVVRANLEGHPADVILVVDNTMDLDMSAVEASIGELGYLLQSTGLDYRVIVVTQHGAGTSDICVRPPLGGTADCNGPPVFVPGQFYRYSVAVNGGDALCKVLSTLHGATGLASRRFTTTGAAAGGARRCPRRRPRCACPG